ncbi:hypothetical protein SAMN03159496_05239 [Rhizobium sp. NFR07]|nr:hypothetical protein SAMN03159496_05239 [Rhizobium sp. NFR07]
MRLHRDLHDVVICRIRNRCSGLHARPTILNELVYDFDHGDLYFELFLLW